MIDLDLQADLERTFAAALDGGRADPAAARRRLLDSGWIDALEAAPEAAVLALFAVLGRTGVEVGALDDVLLQHLPQLAGESVAIGHRTDLGGQGVEHLVVGPGDPEVVVLTPPIPMGPQLQRVKLVPGNLLAVAGIDPSAGLRRIAVAGATVETIVDDAADAGWVEAQSVGRRALAVQLDASTRGLLELAVEYALGRRQFDRAIGSFQAVQHRLASVAIALAAAEAATALAFCEPSAPASMVAKALAGRAAEAAGKHCLQVFGGVGFTEEHDFQRFHRRNLVLDRLLGSASELEALLGARLLLDGVAPVALSLAEPVAVGVRW